MNTTIYIRDLRIFAHHGVLPQERTVGAFFIINMSIEADVSEAMRTDDIRATVSYADLLDVVKREMAIPAALLEHVAWRTANAVLDGFPLVEAVSIDIMKQNPPMGADCAGAGIHFSLHK